MKHDHRSRTRARMLLALRQQREQVARQDFLLAQAEVEAVQARIVTLKATLEDYDQAARQAAYSGGQEDLRLYRGFAVQVRQAVALEERRLAASQDLLDECRRELDAARREVKAVQMLQDRIEELQDAAAERETVKQMDDQHASHSVQTGKWERLRP
ncbi:MAG: Flagellar FliJ protein [Planctomycetes bacterium ADurb.Bin126]|nr:MAG: Flagellar FliJ protein [Planctomycetes bacterium ADurb.Bin126]HOD82598.1 flagellar FliJ family protein [Phycisphaerae bacterium]HQL75021.1 flagellar FliJ family protein [Phycisphaerae bacterium]